MRNNCSKEKQLIIPEVVEQPSQKKKTKITKGFLFLKEKVKRTAQPNQCIDRRDSSDKERRTKRQTRRQHLFPRKSKMTTKKGTQAGNKRKRLFARDCMCYVFFFFMFF
jgi:hypothetical protein